MSAVDPQALVDALRERGEGAAADAVVQVLVEARAVQESAGLSTPALDAPSPQAQAEASALAGMLQRSGVGQRHASTSLVAD
jgi:hypothetical protein